MARLHIKTPRSYETDSLVDVTSVNFDSKKIHEDKIFDRQSIQRLQIGKIPKHEIGTLRF